MAHHKKTDRAKIFAPFDALKGYREALLAQERIVVPKIDISDEIKDELDRKFNLIQPKDIITITYYDKDEYIKIVGMISRICKTSRTIYIVNTPICFDDIYKIEIND